MTWRIEPDPGTDVLRDEAGEIIPNWWKTVRESHLYYDDELVQTVPAEFETDLSSIPRPLWLIPGYSKTGKTQVSAVHHDFDYQTGFLDRETADEMFRECSIRDGLRKSAAYTMHRALRMFGWWNYKGKS